ncbi:hypothetical protein AAY473_016683 [Plecturocebus cupreus]
MAVQSTFSCCDPAWGPPPTVLTLAHHFLEMSWLRGEKQLQLSHEHLHLFGVCLVANGARTGMAFSGPLKLARTKERRRALPPERPQGAEPCTRCGGQPVPRPGPKPLSAAGPVQPEELLRCKCSMATPGEDSVQQQQPSSEGGRNADPALRRDVGATPQKPLQTISTPGLEFPFEEPIPPTFTQPAKNAPDVTLASQLPATLLFAQFLSDAWQPSTTRLPDVLTRTGLTPVIPALWEAKVSGSRGQEFKTSRTNMVKPHLYKTTKISQGYISTRIENAVLLYCRGCQVPQDEQKPVLPQKPQAMDKKLPIFHMAGEASQSRQKAKRSKSHLTRMAAGKERMYQQGKCQMLVKRSDLMRTHYPKNSMGETAPIIQLSPAVLILDTLELLQFKSDKPHLLSQNISEVTMHPQTPTGNRFSEMRPPLGPEPHTRPSGGHVPTDLFYNQCYEGTPHMIC